MLDYYSLPLVKGTVLQLRMNDHSTRRGYYRILKDTVPTGCKVEEGDIQYNAHFTLAKCDKQGRIADPNNMRTREVSEAWLRSELEHGGAILIFTPTSWHVQLLEIQAAKTPINAQQVILKVSGQ
jgi:hypothetical protein